MDYKISFYNIIHKNIIYNSLTRALLILPESVINGLKEKKLELLDAKIIDILIKFGILIDKNTKELRMLEFFLNKNSLSNDTLGCALIPTYKCNCSCVYCYADGVKVESEISPEILNFTLKWLRTVIDYLKCKTIDFSFHGGEPLLKKDIIMWTASQVNDIIKSKGLQPIMSVVTNGTLLSKKFIEKMLDNNITRALITLDGTASIHDKRRPFISGDGTFDIIFKNIQIAIERGMYITLGINFDKQNFSQIFDLLDILEGSNLGKYKNFQIIVGAVRRGMSPSNLDWFRLYETSKKEAAEMMLEIYREALKREIRIVDPIGLGLCTLKSAYTFMIDPYGNIYKCITLMGRKEAHVGTIFEPFELVIERVSSLLYSQPWRYNSSCQCCIYLPLCLGGCFQQALLKDSNFLGDKVDCMKSYLDTLFPSVLDLLIERFNKFPELREEVQKEASVVFKQW